MSPVYPFSIAFQFLRCFLSKGPVRRLRSLSSAEGILVESSTNSPNVEIPRSPPIVGNGQAALKMTDAIFCRGYFFLGILKMTDAIFVKGTLFLGGFSK